MRVELGEALAVEVDGRRITEKELGGRIARRVLAVLALDRRPLPRDVLAEAVWGATPPKTWDIALRGAVHRIRRAVGDDLVTTAFGCYQLAADATVDLLQAVESMSAAEAAMQAADPADAMRIASAAAARLDMRFLPGEDGEWFEERRRELATAAVRARLAESTAATAVGDHRRAIVAAEAALRHDRYHEDVYRRLMGAHAAGGNRAEALVAYRRCREVLAEDLGVDPSPATEAAYVSLLGEEPRRGPTPVAPRGLPATLERPTSLCGRDEELASARPALDDALVGATRFVVLAGPAGAGKSRLAYEIASIAHEDGASVVHGRFDPDAVGPYAAITEALGQLGAAWPPPMTAPGFVAEHGPLLASAAEVVEAVTAAQPLVIVVDDVHWADRASIRVLGRLAKTATNRGLLLLATARSDIISPALTELLTPGDDECVVVGVGDLEQSGTRDLVGAWLGNAAEDDLVEWVHARSGGNPFFACSLLHQVSARRSALPSGGTGLTVPTDDSTDVLRMLADAVAHLGPVVGRALDAAAVIGPQFRVDDVAACVGLRASEVLAALEMAARAGLVGQSAVDPGRFQFAHSLVREARLEQVAETDRRQLHEAAAEALARTSPRSPELVPHLLASQRAGAAERAARVAVAATQHLLDTGAPETARDLLLSVLGALDADDVDAPAERARVLAALASALMVLREIPRARDHLREAARIAVALRNPDVVKPIQAAFLAPAVAGGADTEMIDLVEALLELASPGTPLRVALLCWLSMELCWTTETARAAVAIDEALATARGLRDPFLFLLTAHAWHFISRSVHPAVRRAVIDEARQCYDRLGQPPSAQLLVYLTVDNLELGDRHAAVEAAREAAGQVVAGDVSSYYPWLLRRTDVMLATLEGRLADAERLGEAFAAMSAPAGSDDAQLQVVLQTLVRRYHQGRLGELQPLVAAFAAQGEAPAFARCVQAWVDVEAGSESASTSVRAAVDAARALPRDMSWKLAVAVTAEAAAGVSDPGADSVARLLEPWSGLHVITNTVAYLGAVDRYLALGAAAAGDAERAVHFAERGLDDHRTIGSVPYVARSAAELAAMLARRAAPGDLERAAVLRAEAQELASRHGLGRVRALLDV